MSYQEMQSLSKDSTPSGFKLQKDTLINFFKPDHIHDGDSLSKLQDLGGIDSLCKLLKTSPSSGINQITQDRIDAYGRNESQQVESKSMISLIIEQFGDPCLKIITVAAIASLIVGVIKDGWATGWMEGVDTYFFIMIFNIQCTICIAILIIVSVTSTNDYLKEKQFQKLNAKLEQRDVMVKRNNQKKAISIYDLVVGDIFYMNIGEIFPVDGIITNASDIEIDESAITGESDLIRKAAASYDTKINTSLPQPFVISGSRMMNGQGEMIVCSVGEWTYTSIMKEMLQEESQPTPLQCKLEKVADQISLIGIGSAALVFVALMVHMFLKIYHDEFEFLSFSSLKAVIDAFLLGVTIIVVAVPEGLPLAVTIALAYSVNKMKDEQNLVRQLSSCEIMGGANNVCTDKTGTLTQNKMRVELLMTDNRVATVGGSAAEVMMQEVDPKAREILGEMISLNSTAEISNNEHLGNKTECALLDMITRMGMSYQRIRQSKSIIKVFPFSSARKRMSVVYEDNDSQRLCVKGAAEIVLGLCQYILGDQGQRELLTEEHKQQIQEQFINNFARQTLRTISIAYKDLSGENILKSTDEELENELTLVAIAGIKDPLRLDVPQAVATCQQAGIKVRMVTGDNVNTARAIAQDAGILRMNNTTKYGVMEGKEFRRVVGGIVYDDPEKKKGAKVRNLREFTEISSQLCVLARSSPDDKYLLVTGLKQLNNVVAVTGDGTNDAPALKKADIGFAMGITGTEVAKEAAGIILLDDNFSSIVTACKWGRNIYDSIRKFIQFQLTVNLVALFMAMLGAIVLKESPLNAIQMLWVNLIMDTFAALALATEPPGNDLLQRQPYSRNESIINPCMWKTILCQSFYQIIILIVILFYGPGIFSVQSSMGNDPFKEEKGKHFTIFFQAFVLMQVFNEINCRKLLGSQINVFEGFFNNGLFLMIIITTIVVQILFVEFGGAFIRCSALNWNLHLYCLLIGLGSLIAGLIAKLLPDSMFSCINLLSGSDEGAEQQEDDVYCNIFQVIQVEVTRQKSKDYDQSLTSKMKKSLSLRLQPQTSFKQKKFK